MGIPVITLDTNCLIDLDEGRQPQVGPLEQVVQAHRDGGVRLTVCAMTASENPRSGDPPKTFPEFTALLERVGLSEVEILKPIGYWSVSFWGQALWTSDEMRKLEQEIHHVLAPNLLMDDMSDDRRWRNTKCDVQMVWTHVWHDTGVLLTSDTAILRKAGALAALGANVESPKALAEGL